MSRTVVEEMSKLLADMEAADAAQGQYGTRIQNMYIDVKEYDVTGDGTTDDRTTIQAAITAIGSYDSGLFFSAETDEVTLGERTTSNTYKISSDLTFPSNITLLFGTGATLSIDTGVTVTINGEINTLYKLADVFTGEGSYVYNGENRIDINDTHRASDGSDHSFIDQSIISGSSPTLDGANITGVDADNIIYTEGESVGEILDETLSSGLLHSCVVTDVGGLAVTWEASEIWDAFNDTEVETVSGGATCTDNITNYLVWKSGSTLTLGTARANISAEEISIAHITCQAGDIWEIHQSDLIHVREYELSGAIGAMFPATVTSGLVIGENAGGVAFDVAISTGISYDEGHHRHSVTGFNTTDGNDLVRWYHNNGTTWTSDTNAQINNTQWDNPSKGGGQGLENFNSNKYYPSLFFLVGETVHWVYPSVQYDNVAQAIQGGGPSIPVGFENEIKLMCVVMQQGDASFPTAGGDRWVDIRPLTTGVINAGIVTDHNNLSGLNSGDYIHMTADEAVVMGNTSNTNTGDEVVATGNEVDTGTNNTKMVTPLALSNSLMSLTPSYDTQVDTEYPITPPATAVRGFLSGLIAKGLLLYQSITHGDFDATTNWTPVNASGAVASNVYSLTGNGSGASPRVEQEMGVVRINHKMAIRIKIRVTNAVCNSFYILLDGTTGGTALTNNQPSPSENIWYDLSCILEQQADFTGNLIIKIYQAYADAGTANGKVMQKDGNGAGVQMVDLTIAFGAGNEPTEDEVASWTPDYWEGFATAGIQTFTSKNDGETEQSIIILPAIGASIPNGVTDRIYHGGDLRYYHEKNISDEYTLQSNDISAIVNRAGHQNAYATVASFAGLKTPTSGADGALNVEGYPEGSGVDGEDNTYYTNPSNIYWVVPLGTWVDLAAAKADLAGLKMYYELATTIVTEQTEFTDQLLGYGADGTIYVTPEAEKVTAQEISYDYTENQAAQIEMNSKATNATQ